MACLTKGYAMKELTIVEFVAVHGQSAAAKALNLSQPAIWKALHKGRDIRIRLHDDGRIEAYEIKPIGKKAA